MREKRNAAKRERRSLRPDFISEAALERRRAYHRDYYVKNRERVLDGKRDRNARNERLRGWLKSGWSLERYDEYFRQQDGRCAICLGVLEKRVAADHDHATGVPRGLLCSQCNTALGLFKEDRTRILAAITYLERWA